MDYFDEIEKNKEEKERFIKVFNRNKKVLQLTLGLVFIILGFLFIGLGIGMYFIEPIVFYVFIGIGPLFLILGIIFYIVFYKLDANKAYKKMQDRIKSGKTIYNTYEMSQRIIMLENRVKNLEEELESLRKKLR